MTDDPTLREETEALLPLWAGACEYQEGPAKCPTCLLEAFRVLLRRWLALPPPVQVPTSKIDLCAPKPAAAQARRAQDAELVRQIDVHLEYASGSFFDYELFRKLRARLSREKP